MAVRDFLEKLKQRKDKFKQMEEEFRLQKKLEERQKSSNERELERFDEEEREKSIKKNLEEFRAMKQKAAMETNVLSGGNMFKGKATIMDNGKGILNQKNIFAMKKCNQKGGMFFK